MPDFTLQNNATISNSTSGTMKLVADTIEISGNLVLAGDTGITIQGGSNTTVSQTGTDYTISSTSTSMTIAEGTNGATTVVKDALTNEYTISSTDTNTWGGGSDLTFNYGLHTDGSSEENGGTKNSCHIIFKCWASNWDDGQGGGERSIIMQGRRDGNSHCLCISSSVSGFGYRTVSDERYKHNKLLLENGIETINKLKVFQYDKTTELIDPKYTYNIKKNSFREIGIIAQDLEKTNDSLLNQCVSVPYNKKDSYYVNNNSVFYIAIKAIQELTSELKAEKEKTAKLEADISAIKSHLGI